MMDGDLRVPIYYDRVPFFFYSGQADMTRHILLSAFQRDLLVSLESLIADGTTVLEREYEIYGSIEDLSVLETAERKEFQEQWGLPTNTGSIRVRKTIKGDETQYTQTIKIKGAEGNDENEMDVSEETFLMFKRLVANGLIKTRYFFPVPNSELVLEVDVFQDLEGKPFNEVKIDLEVPEGMDISQVVIPFKLDNPRLIKPGKKSAEDLDFVRGLFSSKYEQPNPEYQKKD